MNHIVRKPFREWSLTPEVNTLLDEALPEQTRPKITIDEAERYVSYVTTTNNKMVQCFPFVYEGSLYNIVEPHPVTLYFNIAQFFIKHINERRDILIIEIQKPIYEININAQLDAIYTFYSNFSMFAISLYNSIEAFSNYAIPDNFELRIDGKRNTELWNKDQLQRHFATDRKLWEILPNALGKTMSEQQLKRLKIVFTELKKCRDEIAHTKQGGTSFPNAYKEVFVTALNFDYNNALDSAAEIINFYEPNLIEECGCGQSH